MRTGPFEDDPLPPVDWYRMYHGTTRQSGERILESGFVAPDFRSIVDEVAAESSLAVDDWDTSLAEGSFAYGRLVDPDPNIYFTDSPLWAADWAAWGGEALMETWAAVYRIRNPRTSPIENGPQAWAVKRLAAEPVVLAYDIPSEALMEAGNQGLDPSDLFGPDMQVIRTVLLPAPADSIRLVSHHAVEESVDWHQVMRERGLRYALDESIESDRVPVPDDRFMEGAKWWRSTLLDRVESGSRHADRTSITACSGVRSLHAWPSPLRNPSPTKSP